MTSPLGAAPAKVKRLANSILAPLGARVITKADEESIAKRYDRVVKQVIAVYEESIFPELTPRPGRHELISQLIGTEIPEAMHLLHYLQEALSGPGEVCEMGVAQGATSALIANEILDTDRVLWLYDSFEGLSAPTVEDVLLDDVLNLGSMGRYAGAMAVPVKQLESKLKAVGFPVDRTRIVAGFIRSDLPPDQIPPEVAFAYIDFDLFHPILTGLQILHPRCRSGSVLMVDDYKYFSSGAEAAVRAFIDSHSEQYTLIEATPAAGHFCVLRRR